MTWTNEETLEFIELYRCEAALWNPKNSFYKDKAKVTNAWDRIAAEMKVSVDVLKKKKETLMTAFRMNHKKKLASLKSSDPRNVHNPIWVFYEPMAVFMSEVYDHKSGNINSDDGASSSTTFQEKWKVEVGVEELSSDDFLEEQPSARKRHRSKSPEPASTSTCDKYLASTMTKLANVMHIISKEIVDRQKKNENEDECSLYGKLTAMKLRQMSVAERRELMYEIDTLFIQKSLKDEPL